MRDQPSESRDEAPGYAFPTDLARFVVERWVGVQSASTRTCPPDFATLRHFLSACYQASLMREEARPVTFRAILAPPDLFPPDGMAPESAQPLAFGCAFPLDPDALRRLSVATDTQRTLIGLQQEAGGALRIWGLVNSGPRWLRDVRGGRRAGAPLPPALVAHVDAPGSITVYVGQALVGKLHSGQITGARSDAFISAWLPERFGDFRDELMARHSRARAASITPWAPLAAGLPRQISDRMMKRVIALLREARHGGTIVCLPVERASDLSTADPCIDLKYPFECAPGRRSFADLVVSILNRLALLHGGGPIPNQPVGWQEFETTTDEELATLDEALFETAHLIAGLASVDGAVVMNTFHDILGFGGMISGGLPPVRSVARALDLNATRVEVEATENVGTRHRSAYRLAGALPGVVIVVISQDGTARFVAQQNGRVTYWEQE